MYWIGFIIPLLSFILQIWPRLKNRYFGVDTWRHLLLADYIRKNHSFPAELKDHYIHPSGNPGYPPLIYLFASVFPKRFAEKYQFIFSPFFDVLHNLFIFYVGMILFNDIRIAVAAQLIAALTPVVVIEASNFSTRVLSYVIFSFSFFPLLMFVTTGMTVYLLIAFIFLVLLFFTHKFAVQAYFFFSLGFSLIERNPVYILIFLVSFLTAYFVFGSVYRPILHEHLSILKFWINHINLRFVHQFRGVQKSEQIKDFVHRLFLMSYKNPAVYIAGNNPWLVFSLVLYTTEYFGIPGFDIIRTINPIVSKLEIWILISLACAIVTLSIPRLRFLGEGNRYVEYSVLPLSLFLGSYFVSGRDLLPEWIFILLVLFLVVTMGTIIFIQKKVILHDRMRTITPELWNIIHYLNSHEGKQVRLAIFPLQFGDAMTYFLKGKVLTTYNNEGLENLKDIYPVLKISVQKLIQKYNLNYILFDSEYVTITELKLKKYKTVRKKNGYYLIRV